MLIAVAIFVALLAAGTIPLAVYDASRDDLITEGITVAGVDIGGMRAEEAEALLRRRVAPSLERPVTVAYGSRRFTLPPERARLRADVGATVDAAIEEGRGGIFFSRALRDLAGGDHSAAVRPRVSYSRSAMAGFVANVKRDLDRPPLDAKVNFPSLSRVKERKGIEVYGSELSRRVTSALASTGRRVVQAPVRISQPKVTRAQLADNYPRLIVVDRSAFRLRFYKRLRLVKTYRISVGMVGLETPAGLHRIREKAKDPAWQVPNKPWAGELAGRLIPGGTPDNPLKERWLGVGKGIGVHGTDENWSLGKRASHGCIRMAIPDVIELYKQVPRGTPIYIG